MKKSDDLYNLIKSLTRNEKGYFKKYAFSGNAEDERNYFRLFDAIDEQEEYNEEKLESRFREEPFSRQLHRLKNYLFNLILKTMRAYRSKQSVETLIKEHLQDIHFLHEKGLYSQAKKFLKSAKELAYLYEKFSSLQEILDWERKIISKNAYSLAYSKTLDEIMAEREQVIALQKNIYEYEKIFDTLDAILNENFVVRSEKVIQPVKDIIRHPLMQKESSALTHTAKILYYYILAEYEFASNNWSKAYEYCKMRRALIESREELWRENPTSYVVVLRHILFLSLYELDFSQFKKALHALRSIPGENREIRAQVFEEANIHELQYFIITGQFGKGLQLIDRINPEMPLHKEHLSPLSMLVFNYHYAYTYFGAGEFRQALRYINEVLNNKEVELRQDILCYSRILNLMIHFELRNHELLEYSVKSAKRYLNKKNKLYLAEKKILKFFGRMVTYMPEGEERISSFRQLRKELIVLSESMADKNVPELYQFNFWLESKIKNTTLESVIKKYIPDG